MNPSTNLLARFARGQNHASNNDPLFAAPKRIYGPAPIAGQADLKTRETGNKTPEQYRHY
jgi:hypothetical protein